MGWNWRKDLSSTIVILSAVAGICLIIKVWVMRHFLNLEVEVNSLIFPLMMLVFYEMVEGIRKKKPSMSALWVSPVLWSIAIVIVTIVSMIEYL